jgi:hypothetical protein
VAAAALSPVIIINVDKSRCDALILRKKNDSPMIDRVPLKSASLEKIQAAYHCLNDILTCGRTRQREPYPENRSMSMSISEGYIGDGKH